MWVSCSIDQISSFGRWPVLAGQLVVGEASSGLPRLAKASSSASTQNAVAMLLASSYETDRVLFVLDIWPPHKIVDIAVEITGLRPGEKLYEELLIDNNSLIGTPHPKILRAEEDIQHQLEVAGKTLRKGAASV